jgi:lysine 2,3-aminomutase
MDKPGMNTSRAALRTPQALAAAGLVEPDRVAALEPVAARYAVAVTPAVAALIRGKPTDHPMARQFIPSPAELQHAPEERADPIGDAAHEAVPGVIHRYPDRVLLKVVHSCPVYCRFCFRREMVGPGGKALAGEGLDRAIAYIADDPAIFEVILTGGDPFMLPAARAAEITRRLAAIDHVKVLRWHTRVPVVDPSRVTPDFVKAIARREKAIYVAIHANHPDEFTTDASVAIRQLAAAGIALLSQSVLLKGVNDNVETLAALMRAFVANRVKPYYLHHADLAPGTAHFRTTIAEGQALMRALRGRLSGLCQPEYVIDIPGGHGKAPIGPVYLSEDGIMDWRGTVRGIADGEIV